MSFDICRNRVSRSLLPPAVKEPWVTLLLEGKKTWELRGSPTNIRGRVGLVASGTGRIFGGATLVGCRGPLSADELRDNQERHRVPLERAGSAYKETYAWCAVQSVSRHASFTAHARFLSRPARCRHALRQGAAAGLICA